MRSDAHLASRHRAAQQHIPRDLIFRKVCIRMVVFNLAFQQSSCAGKTTPLMADRRQHDSIRRGSAPDALILAAIEDMATLRGFQSNPMDPSSCHFSFDARKGKLLYGL
jgi:hypothetical protein